MSLLELAQRNFIDAINHGPEAVDHALFDGPADRILLGLRAHANTVSHARLVALEETFPLTREQMGEARFNALSRDFTETALARSIDVSAIGKEFPAFLAQFDHERSLIELASIEWQWLESYNAVDALPLALADLGDLDEADLLAMPVSLHPSARIVEITVPLTNVLGDLAGTQPAAIVALRPDAEVLISPLTAVQLAIARAAEQKNATLGNLLAVAIETAGEAAPLGSVMELIGAGALVKQG